MVQSLIEQLQLGAVDGAEPITDLLRRAKLAAVKLKTHDFAAWVDLEMNGYADQSTVPDYRMLRGDLKFLNPFHGWQPVLGLENMKRGIMQPIGELAELAKVARADSGFLTVGIPDGLRRRLLKNVGFLCDIKLHVSTTSVSAVVEAVRNMVLNWTLQLEEAGITGQGLTFTPEEANAAQNMMVQHHYHGPIASIAQGNNTIASVSQSNSSATPQDIADAISRLLETISPSAAVTPEVSEAASQLAASERELRSGRIPFGRITKAIKTLGKAEDLALRAPEIAARLHDLGQMLGLL